MVTHLFRRLPENLAQTELGVDSGQLAVAVMPLASLAAKGEDYVRSCCHVLPIHAGESVGVEISDDTVRNITVSHGSDLRVPEDAAEPWVLVAGDPCYFLDGEYGEDTDYGRACASTLDSEERCGFVALDGGGRAFVSSTVYGDGSYPVLVYPGRFALALAHIEIEDEDDGWGWDDEDDDSDDEDELLDGEDEE